MVKNPKTLALLLLSVSLVTGAALMGGCVGRETGTSSQQTTQIIEDITPQEAYTSIQENQDNPDFAIIDVRTPEEFTEGHIEGAINIDFYSETFPDELNILDKNKAYLIYCRSGGRSGDALVIMASLDFKEVHNMTGGIIQWEAEGFPTVQGKSTHSATDITPQEAFALMQSNPDVVIIDVRTPEDFAREHIEGAINIDYHSEPFADELKKLDKSKTYIAYCSCPGRGISGSTVDMMAALNFKEAYNIFDGLDSWKAEGFPTVQGESIHSATEITPQEAFALIQENQNNPDFVIIDVGKPESFATEHIEGAINIDYYSETFRDEIEKLDKNKTYIVYCRCPGRGISGKTTDIMTELNFEAAYNIYGGLSGWKAEGLPTTQ